MKKLSLLSLIFIATSSLITAMGNMEYEDKEEAERLSMAHQNTEYMLSVLTSQAENMASPRASLMLQTLQNQTLQSCCQNILQYLAPLMAKKNKPAAPMQPRHESPEEIARHVQALALQAEHEENALRINAELAKLEQELSKQLVKTKTVEDPNAMHDMFKYSQQPLEGQELLNAIDQYVAHMNTIESSLGHILHNLYASQAQKDKVYQLIQKACHQSQAAKNGLIKN